MTLDKQFNTTIAISDEVYSGFITVFASKAKYKTEINFKARVQATKVYSL